MEARIVREELQKCHKAEGVNHYQACSDLANKYHSLLADAKVRFRPYSRPNHTISGALVYRDVRIVDLTLTVNVCLRFWTG